MAREEEELGPSREADPFAFFHPSLLTPLWVSAREILEQTGLGLAKSQEKRSEESNS